MLMLALSEADHGAIFSAQFGKLDGNGEVGSHGVAEGIADVVGQSANGKRQFVSIARVAEKVDNEISGADVVGEIREEPLAEGVIPDVLYDTPSICVSAGALDL
jgi:hypothetical protein